jgi:hypothetical protein
VEIIFEILGGLLELVGEFLLQVVFEALAEVGLHSVKSVFEKRPDPVFAALGYIILGAAAGGLSLLLVPHLIIHHRLARIANLVLTPLASGAVMAAIGALRRRRDEELVRLDRFGYSVLFAASMAVVRFVWGT